MSIPGLLCSILLAAPPSPATVPPKVAMQGAFDSLTTLVWLTSANTLTPEQIAEAQAELGKLQVIPHSLKSARLTTEPGLAAVASLFNRYVAQTRFRLESGDRDTVRYRVRTLASLCFACHSREQVHADFADAEKRFEQLGLSPLERARVLAATRQFDAALAAWKQVLQAGPDKPDFQRALEESLVVLVRVRADAAATAAFLDEVGQQPMKEGLKAVVTAWREDVKAWQAEPTKLEARPLAELLKASEALIATNRDVPLLRASAALTHALASDPKSKRRGDILFLLGLASGGLRTPLLWDLDLLYLETCVRENPKTPLAKKCAERFEQRLTLGFTGSAGTNIPGDEQQRLDEVKKLAGK
jgi:tetratricopeptide (TPR) repeat protein